MKFINQSMKSMLLACLLNLLCLPLMAQQTGIKYENISFDQAMSQAEKTGKIIFADVQRNTPTELNLKAEQTVFTIDSIADFFSKHIIAIKIDMHSDAGKAFAPRLNMLMYPAYVFYDAKGAEIGYTNAAVVTKDPGVLMEKARSAAATAKIKMENKRSVAFRSEGWNNLLALAKKEGKLIFLDAQTEWCRPCRMMERDVFTLNKVADFYNSNFINVSKDMEKTDGPALNKKYKIGAYPTFLFINGDGEVVHQEVGYQDADPFIETGKAALKKAGMKDLSISGISFGSGSWKDMLQLAEKENKLIFVDCYAVWCGPCKIMDKEVFTQRNVGDFFNSNFVNVKMDMEKGEGITLKNAYQVKAYPTFLFINGKGEEVHRIVGSSAAQVFLAKSKDALNPAKQLSAMHKQYEQGTRDPDFVTNYISALDAAYEAEKAAVVAKAYLRSLPEADLTSAASWNLIKTHVKDATDPMFDYVLSHATALKAANPAINEKEELEKHFNESIWAQYRAEAAFDKNKENQIIKRIKRAALPNREQLVRQTKLLAAGKRKEWKNYVSIISTMVKKNEGLINMPVSAVVTSFSYTLIKETGHKYVQQVIGWTDALMPSLTNKFDLSKMHSLRAAVYNETGDTQKADDSKKQAELLANQGMKESKSGTMMMVPMTLK
ncbi:thioredoxin fold domain-containing protein [Pedobacter deserti]|uniref:thioredoxin fold domain-containing protein n=1 Tax=Pedobacter deserti TaxID=2817382 RepID=UPI00210ED8D9|nr:thioredoxin fold domain-containing protein [Pedobacter sp. SYSU D00382]